MASTSSNSARAAAAGPLRSSSRSISRDSNSERATPHPNSCSSSRPAARSTSRFHAGEQIRIDDGTNPAGYFCPTAGALDTGTLSNTDKIVVFGSPADSGGVLSDGYSVDMRNGVFGPGATPETDGNSEVEISINTVGVATDTIQGTSGDDDIRAGKGGAVNLRRLPISAGDADDDITFSTPPASLTLHGAPGDDVLSGNRQELAAPQRADVELAVIGDEGNDILVGGTRHDILEGWGGDDLIDAFDGANDGPEFPMGQEGFDTAVIDKADHALGFEKVTVGPGFGTGAVKPGVVRAKAGKRVQMRVGWSHHQSWKQLRSIALRVSRGGQVLRTVKGSANPSRHGKWLWADASLRPTRAMVGRNLQLQVQATDVHGRTALEPLAGTLVVRR